MSDVPSAPISDAAKIAQIEAALPANLDNDPWLSLEDGAKLAGNLHLATLGRAIKSKRLRAVKINGGRVYRLRASWINAWLMSGEAASYQAGETPRRKNQRRTRLGTE